MRESKFYPCVLLCWFKGVFMPNDKKIDKPSEVDFYKNIVSNLPSPEKSSWMWFGLATVALSKAKKRGRK
jgi:hypothetical protein